MKLRVSVFGALLALDGRLVWDDTLEHRQTILRGEHLAVLASFSAPRDWQRSFDNEFDPLIDWLVQRAILLDITSERALYEIGLLEQWRGWGSLARLYNFSTRSTSLTPVLTGEEDRRRLQSKSEFFPPPERWTVPEGSPLVALPRCQRRDFSEQSFLDVLDKRRSHRNYDRSALMPLADLAVILDVSVALSRVRTRTPDDVFSQNYFRASPSGGGRASTDVYAHVRKVDGLARGNYKYLPDKHMLARVSGSGSDRFISEAVCRQDWLLDCSVIFVFVGDVESVMWKYQTARAYRALFLDAGHLSQVVQMAACGQGYGAGFVEMQRDAMWEEELRISPSKQVILGLCGVGTKAT